MSMCYLHTLAHCKLIEAWLWHTDQLLSPFRDKALYLQTDNKNRTLTNSAGYTFPLLINMVLHVGFQLIINSNKAPV